MVQFDEEAIFHAARKIDCPKQRSIFLEEACGGHQDRYERVCTLLQAHLEESEFLESPPVGLDPIETEPFNEGPGTIIGRYKLLEQIGEGGFAVVYVAEQQEPIHRSVALKLIKPGMDTKQVIARFEAERQALGMMDHPGIARVYDAGATPAGRPYFVMQLIRGVPITEFCDQANLRTKERLELFLRVCHAVQHAHQKGVIHRDIKPTNVLVALHDGRPVPKVIDFGIAKALRQRLTERTLYTNYRQIIGTPQYMSPEQAEFSDLDIDTRSDIYSLGVLLYELLTSTTPFRPGSIDSIGYEEICRRILQEEASTPSRVLSTLGDALPAAASKRQTDPTGLRKLLRGDMDWVVMKSLDKDRTRRYETAEALAADIQRYLDNEPVQAGPPSTIYRLKKFSRKYRPQVATALTILGLLIVCLSVAIVALIRIDSERDQALRNLQLAKQLAGVAVEASDRLGFVPDSGDVQEVDANLLDAAIEFYEQMLQQNDDAATRLNLSRACGSRAGLAFLRGEQADHFARRSIDLLTSLADDHPENADYLFELARNHQKLANLQYADLLWTDAYEYQRTAVNRFAELNSRFPSNVGGRHELPKAREKLAYFTFLAGRCDEAVNSYPQVLKVEGRRSGQVGKQYAELLVQMNRHGDAETQLEHARQIIDQQVVETEWDRAYFDHWMAQILTCHGEVRYQTGRFEKAEEFFDKAESLGQKLTESVESSPFGFSILGWSHYHQSEAYILCNRFAEAEEQALRCLECWSSSRGRMLQLNTALAHVRLGELYHRRNDVEASQYFHKAKASLTEISRALPNEPFCQKPLIALLANCPDGGIRNPVLAVELAEKVNPRSDGMLWRYLALSQYRSGAWEDAKSSIEQSMKIRSNGDPLDWILMSMIQAQLENYTEARNLYSQAVMDAEAPIFYEHIGVLGFQRLRAEAENVLKRHRTSANGPNPEI